MKARQGRPGGMPPSSGSIVNVFAKAASRASRSRRASRLAAAASSGSTSSCAGVSSAKAPSETSFRIEAPVSGLVPLPHA